MFRRAISHALQVGVTTFPVVVLTGPRQSGKTTLLKNLFPDYEYLNFEFPDILAAVKNDPRGFFENSHKKWILDEVQRYPELFSYIQGWIDGRKESGCFILSGSQNFLLLEKISQSLAGRAAIFELLPLSYPEFITDNIADDVGVWKFLYHGSYPGPYYNRQSIRQWYQSYIRTYLERDVRQLLQIRDLAQFQTFLKLCAGYHGQQLNMNALAEHCGISHTTVASWLGILEASYIIFRLQPYYNNYKKRIVKTPKLYFYDSAIVCQLLGIESPDHLKIHASRGAIFEGFILSEIMKTYFSQGERVPLYYWRENNGVEVDVVWEFGGNLHGLEIKSGETYAPNMLASLKRWQKITDSLSEHLHLVYAGKDSFKQHGISIESWKEFFIYKVKNG